MSQRVFKPFLGQKTVFRVKITFKMVLISRMKGVGVCVGVGVKQRLKRGWRFLFFFVSFDAVTVKRVKNGFYYLYFIWSVQNQKHIYIYSVVFT